jgi:acyl-CoA synthetase (NDP forming)
VIEALAADGRVSAIGLHLEGIADAPRLAAAVAAARQRDLPVVALVVGRSSEAAARAHTHTASLAGRADVVAALLDRLGVARVGSLTALLEACKLLHAGGPLGGRNMVSLSCSGGEAALVADAAEGRSLRFGAFSDDQAARIGATVHPLVTVSNPFDYHTFDWYEPERLRATFEAVAAAGHDLATLVIDQPHGDLDAGNWVRVAEVFAEAMGAAGRRAAVLATLPECLPEQHAEWLLARGVAPLQGVDDALEAMEAAARVGDPPGDCPPVLRPAPPATACRALSEWEAKCLLAGHGVVVPDGTLCADEPAALEAFARAGGAVAMKASCAGRMHKSEAGALVLGVDLVSAVRVEFRRLLALGDAVLIESMVEGVAELIVGVARDAMVGPHLVLGAGGVLAEVLVDRRVLLLPVARETILAALHELRLAPLLTGYRGRPAADLDAVADAVLAVQRFALEHLDSLETCEINPLLVRAAGAGAVALDAVVEFRTEPGGDDAHG